LKNVGRFNQPVSAAQSLALFDLETRRWSSICMRLPLDRIYYQLHVSEDAEAITIVTYDRVGDTPGNNLDLRLAAIRVSLRRPEKLAHICLFQMREQGVSANFKHLLAF
jgi:hypothetical protein